MRTCSGWVFSIQAAFLKKIFSPKSINSEHVFIQWGHRRVDFFFFFFHVVFTPRQVKLLKATVTQMGLKWMLTSVLCGLADEASFKSLHETQSCLNRSRFSGFSFGSVGYSDSFISSKLQNNFNSTSDHFRVTLNYLVHYRFICDVLLILPQKVASDRNSEIKKSMKSSFVSR